MLELMLCSMLTIFPDYLFRRYVQGKRLGKEINIYTVWFELRWGIVACLVLTISLITMIFYYHPSTKNVTAIFRSVTILPEAFGRVSEVYVDVNERVKAGQPLFRLDDSEQRAAAETARRRIAEVEAETVVAESELATADGQIVEARSSLAQAQEELDVRTELRRRNPDTDRDARDRAAAGGGRRPAGLAGRRTRQQGDAADPHRLGAAGAEGECGGRAGAGAGRARQDAGQGRGGRHGAAVHAAARRRGQPDHPHGRHPGARRAPAKGWSPASGRSRRR